MADTVGEFLIKLGLDANGLDKQLNSVVGNVKSGLSNLMSGVVGPALAGLAGAGFVQSFADEITQVSSLSDALGVNIETLSAWRTAAEMAGVEADEVGEIFADFNDWMVDAKFNEGGAMYTDFISNGLLPAVTDANGEMKKTEDYILEFADALHNMDQAQASGIARQIGVSDLKTATWLQQGGDAIRRQLELAKEIGTFTEEDALAAKEYSMSVTVLTHSIKMGLLPIFRAIVPTLTNIAKGFRELVKQVEPSISSFGKTLGDVFTQASSIVGSAFKILADNIIAIAPLLTGLGIMKLVSVFKNMAVAIKTASIAAKAFIFSPWGAVLTALVAIGFAVQEFIKWLNGGESVLSGFFETIFGGTDNAKAMLDDIYNTFMNVVSNFMDTFSELVPHFEELGKAIMNLFNTVVGGEGFDMFVTILVSVVGFIMSVITGLINFLSNNSGNIAGIIGFIIDVLTGIIGVITSVVEAINSGITSAIEIFNTLGAVIEQIGNIISTIFNTMAGAFNSFVSAVSSGASTIIGWISNILSKLAELASNSLLGKVIGSIGGGVSALFSGGSGGNNNYGSTNIDIRNYGIKGVEDLGKNDWGIYPAIGGQK
jgi:phage-related protein|nr:MAG TPA: tail tape measure [Caudoviricetes sp.]